jgi:hypothetical protein
MSWKQMAIRKSRFQALRSHAAEGAPNSPRRIPFQIEREGADCAVTGGAQIASVKSEA